MNTPHLCPSPKSPPVPQARHCSTAVAPTLAHIRGRRDDTGCMDAMEIEMIQNVSIHLWMMINLWKSTDADEWDDWCKIPKCVIFSMCGCRPCLNSSPEVEGDTQKVDDAPNSVLSSDDEKNRPAVQFAHSSVPGRQAHGKLQVIPGRTRHVHFNKPTGSPYYPSLINIIIDY